MSSESQASGSFEGPESCQKSSIECDYIILDETGSSQSEKEDDIIFEREVPGVCSTKLPPTDSRIAGTAAVVLDKLGDNEIELICISSQESSKQQSPTKEAKENEVITIIGESSSVQSCLQGKENSEASKEDIKEIFCLDILPDPNAIDQASTSTKDEEPKDDQAQAKICFNLGQVFKPTSTNSEAFCETDEGEVEELLIQSDLFCLDTKPESSKKKKLGPRFRRDFSSTLKNEDPPDNDNDGLKSDNRCFNCLGDHTLAECPHPRNHEEIKKNRSAYHKTLPPKLANRYHEEKDGKFDRFKPGVISDSLRRALGLRSNDVPMHIYRMRMLGYPPGWVEEMKEDSSGLEFIDAPNSPDRRDTVQTINFDFSRLIDYPGFNVPLSSRYRDDWQYLNAPPMQPHQLKENFIEQLKRHAHEHNNAPRPKHIRFDSGKADDPPNIEIIDMDMDAENDASIEDLEEKRLALLAQLQDDGSNSGSGKSDNGGIQTVTLDDEEEKEAEKKDETDKSINVPASPKESKLLEVGTPVAIRHSSFTSLPDRDKFAKGMGDMELFENLPNSTGTFQKMRSLLDKVRRVFKKS